ncbi:MAG: DUF1343 domain-containing protein [Gemmatimonadetes bacterium]|nr:DUF1343 domain-containing protein [Gemmatimonadota bacterium]
MPQRHWLPLAALLTLAFATAVLTGCEPAAEERASAAASRAAGAARVRPGIEVLLDDSSHLVRGRRVGLITNQTGVSSDGVSSIDLLVAADGIELVKLFAPEHGIRGAAPPGEVIENAVDEPTGLPILSLYGDTRKPTPTMLAGLDALVFDVQDIGTRYYTYVYTMALAMEAAAEAGVRFIVLDRPNPLGGDHVQGNVLDPQFASFVGMYPIPMRHGMTAGELARLFNQEYGLDAELAVVPASGWERRLWFDETGLSWLPPSPNMPSLESATHYPGTCLFEGTNLSVGRGTDAAFQQVGAPWLDGPQLAERLNRYELPGIRFEPVTFTPRDPADGKYNGVAVQGVRFVVTDRRTYDPTAAGVAALVEARALTGDRWEWRADHFDRLAGTDQLRLQIEGRRSPSEILSGWAEPRNSFQRIRERYLLY